MVVRAAARGGSAGGPILSAALFEAEGSSLRISATDGELAAALRCLPQIEEEGRLAVGARVVHELVCSLKDGELTLKQEGGSAALSRGGNRYSLRAYDTKDFPEVPEFPEDEGSFTVPAEGFARDVGRVLPSASKDANRPVLTGVILSVEGGAVRMVATDSYRMSVTARNLREALEVGKRAMVATRRLPEAARIAALCEWLAVATENAVCNLISVLIRYVDSGHKRSFAERDN
jgi:DNA polymerase-3 subunit beta